MIIGISGLAGHGKDTIADIIIKHKPHYKKLSLAYPIKKMGIDIFGFTEYEMYDPKGKNSINPIWNMTGRKFLQRIGTDLFRKQFHPDTWVKCTEFYIKDMENVIIPDIRFENEAIMIQKRNGIIINVCKSNKQNKFNFIMKYFRHASERGIKKQYINYEIVNNGTLQDLEEKIIQLMKDINI